MTTIQNDTASRPNDGVWGTVDGVPVTDEVIERIVANAEAGFPGTRARGVGRPRTVGTTSAAQTVTVRLDADRAVAVRQRAAQEHVSASDVMRRALDLYLAS
ncbi:MAG TPA: ribbon-helix-helix domain-containing protein [Arachnia sp.]|jgi:hypothetical protein|nr:ribbon-helix-helix domain-containing protein [Arachnia sp.]